jgi:hypothetical protein
MLLGCSGGFGQPASQSAPQLGADLDGDREIQRT